MSNSTKKKAAKKIVPKSRKTAPRRKADPNQLRLDLTFTSPCSAVRAMAETIALFADAPPEKKRDTHAEKRKKLRESCNRLVGILSLQFGVSHETVWVLAYHRFFKAGAGSPRFHPVVEAMRLGFDCHLDAVEHHDELHNLAKVLTDMLTEPAISPK